MSFWYLQVSQKRNKKIWLYYYGASSQIVFVLFLGELKTPKRHSKLTELYRMPRLLCLKCLKTKWDTILIIYKKNVFYHGAQGIKHNLGWSPTDAILMILDLWLYIHGKHFSKSYIFLQKAMFTVWHRKQTQTIHYRKVAKMFKKSH